MPLGRGMLPQRNDTGAEHFAVAVDDISPFSDQVMVLSLLCHALCYPCVYRALVCQRYGHSPGGDKRHSNGI
ncbi:MAG: hypothetical protein ACI8PT_000568 [Gammaproteobacteria bacterium]|jgi:hypothetical protein